MLRVLIILLSVGIAILGCRAECNSCSKQSNVACVSATQFQFCDNNQATGPINSCPAGSYCTSGSPICQQNFAAKACEDCNKCNAKGTFACTGIRTFALCLGQQTVSDITGSCTEDLVCNVDSPGICVDATTATATCGGPTTTTVSPPTTISLDQYCREAFNGVLKHAIPNDTQCTSYVYCEYYTPLLWEGRIVNCPADKPYFNGNRVACGTIKPTRRGCT